MPDDVTYSQRCACGWEITGSLETVVAATIDHGKRIHNMDASRDEVLAAVLGPAADVPAPEARA